jgi:hypothetical protein
MNPNLSTAPDGFGFGRGCAGVWRACDCNAAI